MTWRRNGRIGLTILFLTAGLLFVRSSIHQKPLIAGDALDYLYPLEALFNHHSPDVRLEDMASYQRLHDPNAPAEPERYSLANLPPHAFREARNGAFYSYHFWFYSLLAVPAKWYLHVRGGNELAAFQVTNAVCFLAALYVCLFHQGLSLRKRLLFAGLAAVTPVYWYLAWPSAEAFTWSFVLISLVWLSAKNYPAAALASAVAAMQNPPVLFLGALIVVLSCRERRWHTTLLSAAAALCSFAPNFFYYRHFRVPNLIVAAGESEAWRIGWARTWSFLTDFNQGMLPYVPILLLLTVVAILWAMRIRHWAGLGMAGVFLAMVLACETTTNWNSGSARMMRYAVWVVPICAWLVIEVLPATRLLQGLALAGVALQSLIVFSYDGHVEYLKHTPVAEFMLTHLPSVYDPDPEIFFERQLAGESLFSPIWLPMPYITQHWRVTKILVDDKSLSRLSERFTVDPDYLASVERKYGSRRGFFYLTPPRGAVTIPPRPTAEQFQAAMKLGIYSIQESVKDPLLPVVISLRNDSDLPFWGEGCPTFNPIRVLYTVAAKGQPAFHGGIWFLPDNLDNGKLLGAFSVPLPLYNGDYVIEIWVEFTGIARSKESLHIALKVKHEPGVSYDARVLNELSVAGRTSSAGIFH